MLTVYPNPVTAFKWKITDQINEWSFKVYQIFVFILLQSISKWIIEWSVY